jgi:hypothetical protein
MIAGFFDMAIFARTSSSFLGWPAGGVVIQIKSIGYRQFYVSRLAHLQNQQVMGI